MCAQNSKPQVENADIKYDRDGIPLDDPKMKGLSRYFNNSTIRGRANVAKATFAGLFGFYLYKKIVKKPPQSKHDEVIEDNLKNAKATNFATDVSRNLTSPQQA